MGEDRKDWPWWASDNGEMFGVGPCATREEAIAEAVFNEIGAGDDGSYRFTLAQAERDPIRLADWLDVEEALERADESLADSDRVCWEYDDGQVFMVNPMNMKDLKERIAKACDEWQEANGLVFTVRTFSHCWSHENVTISAEEAERIWAERRRG